jgi:hypothetical protein
MKAKTRPEDYTAALVTWRVESKRAKKGYAERHQFVERDRVSGFVGSLKKSWCIDVRWMTSWDMAKYMGCGR